MTCGVWCLISNAGGGEQCSGAVLDLRTVHLNMSCPTRENSKTIAPGTSDQIPEACTQVSPVEARAVNEYAEADRKMRYGTEQHNTTLLV